jgi:hypothetical protein
LSYFQVLAPQASPRLWVRDPRTLGLAFLDAGAVGPVAPPTRPLQAPGRWWGSVASAEANAWWADLASGAANLRGTPAIEGPVHGELRAHTPVVVRGWVSGQEVLDKEPTWAQLADDAFIYAPLLRPAPLEQPPPIPISASQTGRWIDVNLTLQVTVAYDGNQPFHLARLTSGRPGWETSTGRFHIARRVETEVMDSSSLLGRDADRASYRVEAVKWTQYFADDGQALHANHWRDPALFGMPSSHGCLGLVESDARWLWGWASLGTPLVVHA